MNTLEKLRKLTEEFKDLNRNPICNFGVNVGLFNEEDLTKWICTFVGPKDTPYECGLFYVSLNFEKDYPIYPPKVKFITPIYHTNVLHKSNSIDEVGTVYLSILHHFHWRRLYKVRDIIISICSLFYFHNDKIDCPCHCNQELTNEAINNKNLYNEKAKYFAKKYADVRTAQNISNINQNSWDFSYNV